MCHEKLTKGTRLETSDDAPKTPTLLSPTAVGSSATPRRSQPPLTRLTIHPFHTTPRHATPNRYYKQRLRTADEREVTVAHRRAAQLRLGAMYEAEMRKGTSTGGAVALQRGERKAFGGLSGVSRPKDVKMLRAHQRSQARERLKTEIRQNKLNKTFDRIMDM